jgi:alpha-beta hydrolase superfamily lysophospholipase
MTVADQEIISRFPVGYFPFHSNVSLNFQMNRFWGWSGEKKMLEEMMAAGKRIKTYDDWTREMFGLADNALAAGRQLPAAYYTKAATFFLSPEDPRYKNAVQLFLDIVLKENHVSPDQHFNVPYQGTQLSAYRFTPANPRGTFVVFGGYDSYILEWLPAALALRDAGLDTVMFDGPGQGVVLDSGVPMTSDWHLPVGAILDFFKFEHVTLMGFSLGGALVLRAAAKEPRVKRAIAFDICTGLFESGAKSVAASGLDIIAQNSEKIPATVVNEAVAAARKSDLLTDWAISQGQRVLGAETPAGVFDAWRKFQTADISHLVKQDVLLMAGTKDHYIPYHMLPDQIATLTAARSVTARSFTEAESAQNHCQVGNTGLALKVIFDWLDQTGGRMA